MLATTGSFEIVEWISELGVLRPEEEKAAMDKAEKDSKWK